MIIDARAYARAGLLGNPSDGYFGKTISLIVKNFGAQVLLYESPELHIEPQESDSNTFSNIYHLRETVSQTGYNGGIPIIKAAIKKFLDHCEKHDLKISNRNFTIRYHSSIPRQVGLAGSSAIVISTLRALMKFYGIDIEPHMLANLALKAETEEMGITAGLQDRVIQSFEGCVYMDFEKENLLQTGFGKYETLDVSKLPKLYIAYKTDLSKVSGKVLNDIKNRYEKGDQLVIDTLGRIAEIAEEGKVAIQNQDYRKLNLLINENFDNRCKIMNISDSNMELVNTARSTGASAKFTGSGGSIIGMYEDDEMLNKLQISLKKINARVIKPYYN
jgi:glucuronokinase